VYINQIYPKNILLNQAGIIKAGRVLLGKDYVIGDYKPKSMLKVNNRKVLRAKYPVIDIHFHLASLKYLTPDELVKAMTSVG